MPVYEKRTVSGTLIIILSIILFTICCLLFWPIWFLNKLKLTSSARSSRYSSLHVCFGIMLNMFFSEVPYSSQRSKIEMKDTTGWKCNIG